MPEHTRPISLNLSTIVFRLVTDPRGWRVDMLRDELGIAPRTYRKYRALLRDRFPEFQTSSGMTRLREEAREDGLWLCLAPSAERPEQGVEAAALLWTLAGGFPEGSVGSMLRESASALRPKDAASEVTAHLSANLDRLVVHFGAQAVDIPRRAIVRTLLGGLLECRELRLGYEAIGSGFSWNDVRPLTLAVDRGGLVLIADQGDPQHPSVFDVGRIASAQLAGERFTYPTPETYHPAGLFDRIAQLRV